MRKTRIANGGKGYSQARELFPVNDTEYTGPDPHGGLIHRFTPHTSLTSFHTYLQAPGGKPVAQ